MDQMTLFDTSAPWITLWQSELSIRIRPPASEGYFLFFCCPTWCNWTRESAQRCGVSFGLSGRSACDESTRSVMIGRAMDHHQRLTVIFQVNPCRGASGFLWLETLDVESVPSPEGCGEWTHQQSSGGHCRDGSGSEHGDVCSTEKPRAGGPEHPDGSHLLSQAI